MLNTDRLSVSGNPKWELRFLNGIPNILIHFGLSHFWIFDEGPRLKLGYKVRDPIPRVLSVQGLCAPADRVTIL